MSDRHSMTKKQEPQTWISNLGAMPLISSISAVCAIAYIAGSCTSKTELKSELEAALHQQSSVDNIISACDGGTVTVTMYPNGLIDIKAKALGCEDMVELLDNFGTNRVEIRNGSGSALILRQKKVSAHVMPAVLVQEAKP